MSGRIFASAASRITATAAAPATTTTTTTTTIARRRLLHHLHGAGGAASGLGGAARRPRSFHNAALPASAAGAVTSPSRAVLAASGARGVSFARMLPKLAVKMVRLPALLGGAVIGGAAWVQYQAAQAGGYVWGVLEGWGDAVGGTAVGAWDGVRDVADRVGRGWDRVSERVGEEVDAVEMPDWVRRMLRLHEDIGTGGQQGAGGGDGKGDGKKGPEGGDQKGLTAAAGVAGASAAAAAFGHDATADESDEDLAKDDQMMVLTRKMIEIRNMLAKVGRSSALTLPSIVVIGSQSSGKSSVLESVVGHEFLPKGANMVTRRPIELTLVNTPDSAAEYGEFPDLGLSKVADFSSIQRTLTELNLAVPDSQCVSDEAIRLTIYSPNVPDLSLIDLPGYIQVVGQDQPLELKQKIAELCDRYIQPPNVILAISAADVDLANSAALRASRRVDPRGERTIGVVTKMDLVDARRGLAILTDKQYPLRLGYVGVVAKAPPPPSGLGGGIFKKSGSSSSGGGISAAIARNERAFFSAHPLEFGPEAQPDVAVGTGTLRRRLMHVLEQTMSASLQSTGEAIRTELEEAAYEFKVQYNDRPLSAESYLAESLDAFKHSFKQFADGFGRPNMLALLKDQLDQRVLDLLAARYWNRPLPADLAPPPPDPNPLADLAKLPPLPSSGGASLSSRSASPAPPDDTEAYWRRQLDASVSALTKSGVGRMATTAVASALRGHVDRLVASSTFAAHPTARRAISDAAQSILDDRFYSTSDQVENCVKPFKFEVDLSDAEWQAGRDHAAHVVGRELKDCEGALRALESDAAVGGRRRLREVMAFVDRARRGDVQLENASGRAGAGGFSAALLAKGREAVFLRDRADILKMRLLAVKSKGCATQRSKYSCPEVFLDATASKLAAVSVLFLNVELLSEFYYAFPRELDARLGGRRLSDDALASFAAEDPKIARHLDVIRRKDLLELVLEKMESLRQLESREREGGGPQKGRDKKDKGGSRWGGLF